ncbi:MAG: tRNA adenosine(34) deaminase TadA [Deltaproteobacteria bacterium]|nr:MAG: tRNA adenosine(34) deaminase TadA [Deltaproteobacteria bacterium]
MREQDVEDYRWMRLALDMAKQASEHDEVPVGAVIVDGDRLLAQAGNRCIAANDPTAHAEIIALREACALRENYRLSGATLYVTLEPCIMCMGAILQARIGRLVFAAPDPKSGAAVSLFALGNDHRLNHQLECSGGLLKEECAGVLQDFFRKKRGR